MSDAAGTSAAGTAAAGDSAGALLRAAREKQGLHIAALAAAIKVTPRKLEALEADRWHELPDATFTRALAQTVCRTLKVDPKPVLDRLPPVDPGGLEQVGGTLNTPFQGPGGGAGPALGAAAIRPMVVAAIVLLLAALVLMLLPDTVWQPAPDPSAVPAGTPAELAASAPTAALAASAASAPVFPPEDAASALAPAASGAQAPVSLPAVVPDSTPALPSATIPAINNAPVPGSPPPATAPQPASVLPPGGERMDRAAMLRVRTTTAASWVEARDANDTLLVSRLLQPGEQLALNGALPIRVVIGNAVATEVLLRGQVVDLAPRTRDNVARLELR